jgi:U4/U6 small nuclear ribonucleoprotein PRP31
MPACNVLVLGAQRKNLEGFSTANKLHRGYLTETDIYKNTPEDYQKQALRKLSTKCVLAARYDAYRSIPVVDVDPEPTPLKNFIKEEEVKQDNSYALLEKAKGNRCIKLVGEDFKDFIMKKMSKIQEPQQPKQKKILPRPDDKPRRKRGGKRMRSLKLRMEQTEIRKMKNRMNFGPEQEVEFRESGKGFGVLGVGGTGSKLKAAVNKGQKINTKKQKLAALQAGVSGNNSGYLL